MSFFAEDAMEQNLINKKNRLTYRPQTGKGDNFMYREICDGCILQGRCDGRCGDTDLCYYADEALNDFYDECEEYEDSYEE